MRETIRCDWLCDQKDSPGEGNITHSGLLPGESSWSEEPDGSCGPWKPQSWTMTTHAIHDRLHRWILHLENMNTALSAPFTSESFKQQHTHNGKRNDNFIEKESTLLSMILLWWVYAFDSQSRGITSQRYFDLFLSIFGFQCHDKIAGHGASTPWYLFHIVSEATLHVHHKVKWMPFPEEAFSGCLVILRIDSVSPRVSLQEHFIMKTPPRDSLSSNISF